MAFKFVLFVTSLAYASAGLIGAPAQLAYSAAPAVSHVSYSSPIVSYGSPLAISTPTLTSQSQNILRSYGNLGQISSHSKTIDTPYSSVSKSDVRISNPGITTYAAQPLAYAQPLAHAQPLAYAQPLGLAAHAQPLAYAQPLLRAQPLAYAQPLAHAQPLAYTQSLAHAQPLAYAQPLAHAQPLAYAQPLAHAQPLAYAQPLAHAPLLTSYAAPHYGSIGSSQQSTLRSLDGNSAVSHQSKAVDSAYSSVRKYDTRITNDAQYAVASPVVSAYAAPLHQTYAAAAPVVKSIGYSTAPVVASAHFQGLGVQYAW